MLTASLWLLPYGRFVTIFIHAGVMASGEPAYAYPAFAQSLFSEPRDATGKIVCSNCHLQQADSHLALPQGVLKNSLFDAHIDIPCRRTNAQLQSDGSISRLQVGMVLALPSVVTLPTDVLKPWAGWSSESTSIQAGPLEGEQYASLALTLRTNSLTEGSSYSQSLFLGANRGRGQVYPQWITNQSISLALGKRRLHGGYKFPN